MADESDKKGFGGLSSLASEVREIILHEKTENPTTEHKSKSPNPPRTADQVPPPAKKFIIRKVVLITGIGILIVLFNSRQDDGRDSDNHSASSPSSSTVLTDTLSRTAPSLEFNKPPTGTNNVLSVAQIRWCLREDIRIETKQTDVGTDRKIDAFNAMVSDYNQRCVHFRYRVGALERARREVEGMRSQIVAEMQISDETVLTYEVQTLLKQLGYNPGPVDGIYGRKTRIAIEQFENDIGVRSKGMVTEELKKSLQQNFAQRHK